MKRPFGPLVVLGALAVCVPCLLPVITVLGGVAVLSTLGGTLTASALTVGLGTGGTIASLALAAYVVRKRRDPGAACESPNTPAMRVRDASRRIARAAAKRSRSAGRSP